MEQITLNGEPKKTEQKETFKMSAERRAELISYFYKACRIGDAETALVLAEKIKRAGMGLYIAKTLIQLLGEDCSPEEWQRLYPTLKAYKENVIAKETGGHCMWNAVYAVATAKKWYQDEEGVEFEKMRHKVKEKELPDIEIPKWVYDRHTKRGWELIKEKSADLRLDGRWDNRFKIRDRWEEVTGGEEEYKEKVRRWIKYYES